jgi:hypothetical protein
MAFFPPAKYNFTSLYILSNGYYIDFKTLGPKKSAQTKTPEGALWAEGTLSFSTPAETLINEAITNLSSQLGIPNLELTEIIEKTPPPPKISTPQFTIKGKIVDVNGDPIVNSIINPILIEFPPPPPPLPEPGNPNIEEYTDFETKISTLPTLIIIDPTKVNDTGEFEVEYLGSELVDFDVSYIEIKAEHFFSKTIGPKLVKTGEENVKKTITRSTYEGSLTLANGLLTSADGTYTYTADYTDASTQKTVTGIGSSINREIAKKMARSNAEKLISPSTTSETTITISIYDVGRITLDSVVIDLEKEDANIKKQVQIVENFEIEAMGKSKLPFEARLSILFNSQKENLKQILIPQILSIIAKFGPQVVHSIVNKKKKPLSDKVCPPKEVILEAIRKRNQLVRQLNNIYKIVRTITDILKITNAVIIGMKISFQLLKLAPIARPSGLIADAVATIKRVLEKAGIVVNILTITAVIIGAVLAAVIELLKSLDFLIQECSEELNEAGEFTVPFVEINNELNTFVNSSGQVENMIDPLTGQPLPYKGFTFEIKEDTSQNFQYPKRYAIARNIQGIQVLRSESSFASSPEILIEELKFAIDRDNLRAD